MKPNITYRKRRDLMLKNFSSLTISNILGEEVLRSGINLVYQKGRPCEIDKYRLIGFLLYQTNLIIQYLKVV